jgi:signal transduction histidine kinase
LGEISARFAHEIRNPLSIIGGFSRRLQDSLPENEKGYNIARIIVEEVSRLEQILRIMLSSIQPVILCLSEFDLNHLLRSLVNGLGEVIKQKKINVEITLTPGLPKIHCDEGLLNQAFLSLLKHAIFSMTEEEKVLLSTIREEEDLIVVVIRYREEGLSEEDLEQFFLPRFTNKVGTPNVGLPLSKVIIHRHRGKIDVSKEEGNIVVIRIELPIRKQN